MTVVRYEPWGLLNRLRRELDQTFESATHDASWTPAVACSAPTCPAARRRPTPVR